MLSSPALSANGYIDNLNKMDGPMRVSIKPSCYPSTIKTIQFLLLTAGVISLAGAIYAARELAGRRSRGGGHFRVTLGNEGSASLI